MQKAMPDVKQQELERYTCKGCGEQVRLMSMQIPVGPHKGDWTEVEQGCRCEDIKLANEAVQRREQAKHQKMLNLFTDHSLMNRSLNKAEFSNYHPTSQQLEEAKDALQAYTDDFSIDSPNLLLHGNYGTGKSHLAVSVTKALMAQGYQCLFISIPKLLTKIKDTYNNNDQTESDILRLMQDIDLLVLDDLGAEHTNAREGQSTWTHSKIFEILDDRSGKPTIFTTNLNSKDLKEKLNERNFSRIMDGTEVIKMNGKDYRRKEF